MLLRRALLLLGSLVVLFNVCIASAMSARAAAVPPVVGEKARDFRLPGGYGRPVQLSELMRQGPVVVVVLRGFPGYQCPACNTQTGQFFSAAEKLRAANAQVVVVYPGQSKGLADHAREFMNDKTTPVGFHVVLDPDYRFTNLYGLRWDAPRETAYPSTFVVDSTGVVRFAKISRSHGGRASVDEVLQALAATK